MIVVLAFVIFAVGLPLRHSEDANWSPTRAMLMRVNVGVDKLEKDLMVDFRETGISVEDCIDLRSNRYGGDREPVFFEDDEGYKNVRVKDHCDGIREMPLRYYENCRSSKCHGIVGLSRKSLVWSYWSSMSITSKELVFGRASPEVGMTCNAGTTGLCDLNANVHGYGNIETSFHLDNSYTFVPARLYEYLRAGNPLVVHFTDGGEMFIPANDLIHRVGWWWESTAVTPAELPYSSAGSTLRVKPWEHEGRMSIGNIVLTRYAFHLDVAANRLFVEPFITEERLTSSSSVGSFLSFVCLIYTMTQSGPHLAQLFGKSRKIRKVNMVTGLTVRFLLTILLFSTKAPDIVVWSVNVVTLAAVARGCSIPGPGFDRMSTIYLLSEAHALLLIYSFFMPAVDSGALRYAAVFVLSRHVFFYLFYRGGIHIAAVSIVIILFKLHPVLSLIVIALALSSVSLHIRSTYITSLKHVE